MNQNIKQQKVLLLSNLAFMYGVNTSKFEKSIDENIELIEKGGIGSGRHSESGSNTEDEMNEHYNQHQFHSKRFNHFSSLANNKSKEISDKLKSEAKQKADFHAEKRDFHNSEYNKLKKVKKSEENTIEKGQISDAFQYSSDSAFKISMTGDEMKKRIATAVPALLSQKQQLKEIANTALSKCDGIIPSDKRNSQALSYSVFSYEQKEPQRSSYQNEYPQKTDCQKQMDIYNSAVYEMLEITKDIVTLNAIKSGLSDSKSYSLTVSQVVAISMGYTEDELAEKAIEVEIEKGGEGSRGGKVIGHTKSGKPIYAHKNASHSDYKYFTKQDHADARVAHLTESNNFSKYAERKFESGKADEGLKAADFVIHHNETADSHTEEYSKIKDEKKPITISSNKNSSAAMNHPNLL